MDMDFGFDPNDPLHYAIDIPHYEDSPEFHKLIILNFLKKAEQLGFLDPIVTEMLRGTLTLTVFVDRGCVANLKIRHKELSTMMQ